MKTLKIYFSGNDSARDRFLSDRIVSIFECSMLGFGLFPAQTSEPAEDIVEFNLSGPASGVSKVCISFVGEDKHSLSRQPALMDIAIAGVPFPEGIQQKLNTLDTNETFGWAVLVRDGAESPVDETRTVTESALAANPAILDKVSHLLIVSDDGYQLALTKLAGMRGCLLFSTGIKDKWANPSMMIACSSVDDFLNKAGSIDGKSKQFFGTLVAPRVFTADSITALSARQLISSALRIVSLPEYGLTANQQHATTRLLQLNKGPSK